MGEPAGAVRAALHRQGVGGDRGHAPGRRVEGVIAKALRVAASVQLLVVLGDQGPNQAAQFHTGEPVQGQGDVTGGAGVGSGAARVGGAAAGGGGAGGEGTALRDCVVVAGGLAAAGEAARATRPAAGAGGARRVAAGGATVTAGPWTQRSVQRRHRVAAVGGARHAPQARILQQGGQDEIPHLPPVGTGQGEAPGQDRTVEDGDRPRLGPAARYRVRQGGAGSRSARVDRGDRRSAVLPRHGDRPGAAGTGGGVPVRAGRAGSGPFRSRFLPARQAGGRLQLVGDPGRHVRQLAAQGSRKPGLAARRRCGRLHQDADGEQEGHLGQGFLGGKPGQGRFVQPDEPDPEGGQAPENRIIQGKACPQHRLPRGGVKGARQDGSGGDGVHGNAKHSSSSPGVAGRRFQARRGLP